MLAASRRPLPYLFSRRQNNTFLACFQMNSLHAGQLQSIDKTIAEKMKRFYCSIKCTFGWLTLRAWEHFTHASAWETSEIEYRTGFGIICNKFTSRASTWISIYCSAKGFMTRSDLWKIIQIFIAQCSLNLPREFENLMLNNHWHMKHATNPQLARNAFIRLHFICLRLRWIVQTSNYDIMQLHN